MRPLTPAGLPRQRLPVRVDVRSLRPAALVFIGYYLGARVGFLLTFPDSPVSTLWAPNALLMAAFLLTPRRSWGLLLLAALPAHLLVELTTGVPIAMTLCWFVSNSAEALIGATLMSRLSPRPTMLDSVTAVGVFVGVALTAPFLSSFLDAAFVTLNDWGEVGYWQVFRIRFFSNVLAMVTIVPVVLASGAPGVRGYPATRLFWLEAGLLGAGLLVVSALVFGRSSAGDRVIPGLIYAPLPFLLWSVVRLGPRGSTTALLLVVLVAAWSAAQGRGPFVLASPHANALTIQVLFTVVAVLLMSLGAVMDERTRAEERARRKGEQLALALDAAQLGTWDWHLTQERPEFSQRAREDLGFALGRESPSFDTLLRTIHPDDRAPVARAIVHALERGSPYHFEFRVFAADGTIRWVLGQGKVLCDGHGRPVRLIGIQADVTERKLAESLKAGETRILGLIATGAPLRDILTSLALLVEAEITNLWCSILLLDPDGVHARHGAAPSLPDSYVAAIDGLSIGPAAGACGTAMYSGERVISADIRTDPLWDEYRDLAVRHGLLACWSTPIVTAKGKVLGSFACYYPQPRAPSPADLGLIDTATHLAAIAIERHRAEAEANEQRNELAHLGRAVMLGQLSSTLAHELNQPLSAIMSNAQAARRLLESDSPPVRELREILRDIVLSDRRARDVIDHMRAMLVRRAPERVPVELDEVAARALHLVHSDLAARLVSVTTEFSARPASALGDRVQLQQVILNLVLNACEAMALVPSAERKLILTTRASQDGWIHLAIRDRGPGIPRELLDHIFQPFVTSKEHGLGLGLAICRSIMAAHGGRLWASNNADRGATFHVSLPALTPPPSPTPHTGAPRHSARTATAGR